MSDLETDFERFHQRRSRRLRNAIVESQMHLVDYHVNRYSKGGADEDDVRQQAMLALIGAVERFDPDGGASFRTFAARTIEGELKRLRRDKGWTVRPPRRVQELSLEVRRAETSLSQKLGRSPRVAEIAELIDESPDRVLEAMAAGSALQAESLDAPTPGIDSSSRGDLVADDGNPYDEVDADILIEDVLRELEPQDRELLTMRFRDQLSQQAIADHLGVSQSYLSRLLRRAIERAQAVAEV